MRAVLIRGYDFAPGIVCLESSLLPPSRSESPVRRVALILLLTLLGCLRAEAQSTSPTQRIRGEIMALQGLELQVRARSGETLTITLAESYAVTAVVPLDLEAIKPGQFVGAASLPQSDGTERALEVLVFPESMRGSNEGHYRWDLQPGSMMTNATITHAVAESTGARRLTLEYKGGSQTLVVPPGTPIVTFEPGDRAMVVAGAHIIVTAAKQPDGSLTAGRVAVGKNGLVPPM